MKNKITLLYLLQFFINASSAAYMSTHVVFYLNNGLNFKEINSFDVIFMITVFLFEIPTGLIADHISKKLSVGIGVMLRFITLAFFSFFHSFISFLIGYAFLAIGETFLSGAQDAWLSNEAEIKKLSLENIFTKLTYFSYSGSIFGGFLGAYVASFQFNYIWILAMSLSFIAVIIFLFCTNPSFKISGHKIKFKNINLNFNQTFTTYKIGVIDSLQVIKSNHYLRNIILYDAFSQFGMTATVRIWQPYFKQLFNFNSVIFLGLIYALFSFIGILSSMSGSALSLIQRKDKIFYAGLIAGLILLLILWSKAPILILTFFFIHVFFQMIKIPLVKSTIHEETPIEHRSTISSFSSCIGTVVESIGFLFFGILLDEFGIMKSLFVAALFFICSALYYNYKLKKIEVTYGQ